MRAIKPEFDRFITKVVKSEGCWEWVGSKLPMGYGRIRRKRAGKQSVCLAHRLSYELFKGPIPEEVCIRHTCDNPSCVNPDHLVIGSHADNMQDMFKRNLTHSKLGNPVKLLNILTVREIREYMKQNPNTALQIIADKYGTSTIQVSRILRNKIWRD